MHFLFHPPPSKLSLSNRKQMGDLCCGLLPNGANSHYNVCKLCLFSPSLTSTPCTTLPSDVFNTCVVWRVILICLVLLITGYLSSLAQNGKQTLFICRLLTVICYLTKKLCCSCAVKNMYLQNLSFSLAKKTLFSALWPCISKVIHWVIKWYCLA